MLKNGSMRFLGLEISIYPVLVFVITLKSIIHILSISIFKYPSTHSLDLSISHDAEGEDSS